MEDDLTYMTENEENSNGKSKEISSMDGKSGLTKLKEYIGFITAIIALCSIIITAVIKYISLGRCLFFDFDLDYYDFSILNTSKYLFILSIVAGIISIIVSFIFCATWNFSSIFINKSKLKKKRLCNWIAVFVLIITFLLFIMLLSFYFIPETYSATYFCIIILVCTYAITSFLLFEDLKREKIIVRSIVSFSILLVFFSSICMRFEYKQALEQLVFPIIENGDEYYTVISQSKENYSAYLCEFKMENEKGVLIIRTDIHKYFKINDTKIIKIEFDKVEKKPTESLTVSEFITKQLEVK